MQHKRLRARVCRQSLSVFLATVHATETNVILQRLQSGINFYRTDFCVRGQFAELHLLISEEPEPWEWMQ